MKVERFSKNPDISNFTKIRPMGAELFHADGRTDKHDESNSRFPQFANAPKKVPPPPNIGEFPVCSSPSEISS